MRVAICLAFSLLLATAGAQSASAFDIPTNAIFGQAAGFNVFTFGDFTTSNSEVLGPVAAGGNVVLTGGVAISPSVAGGDLFAGGNITWLGSGSVGQGGSGQIVLGGNLTLSGGGFGFDTPALVENPFPIDFSATRTLVKNNSALWTGLATTGNVNNNGFGTLTLNAASGLNVFQVDASAINSASSININGPADATVIFNILGNSATFSNGQVNFSGGISAEDVLYNLTDATSVTINSFGFKGSLVAPMAAVAFPNGGADSQIIADSFTGPGEVRLPLFAGEVPTVPLPAAVWLLGAGLAGMVGLRKRG